MRALSVLSAAVSVLLLGTCINAAGELIWKDLFAPPYSAVPQITMSIQCLARDLCYVPGGSNGAGFGVFQFDGQVNGNLIEMNEPNMTMMIMTAAMGGTKTKPVGAFGGMGMFTVSLALQYLSNGSTWLPSTMIPDEFIWATDSMAATDDGQHIISLGMGPVGNSMMHSDDAGKTFTNIPITMPLLVPGCTAPGAASMVTDKIWYVTFGSVPHNPNGGGSSSSSQGGADPRGEDMLQTLKREGKFSSIVRDTVTGQVHRRSLPKNHYTPLAADQCGFNGQIAKTTDAGKTWTVMYNTTENTFSQIDCFSELHCVTAGFGQNADNLSTAVVMTMTDGKTWKTTYASAGSPISFTAVEFADAQEVWLGGGYDTETTRQAIFYVSQDGGMTWKQNGGMQPNLESIMDLSFTKDGVGFAVAMSEFKTSTILRYEKQSFAGWFTQSDCPLANCTFLCQNITFPQGMCLNAQGGSVQAYCSENAVVQRFYETTSCIGSYNSSSMPINSCLNNTQGGFFVNYCNTTGAVEALTNSGERVLGRH